MQAKTQSADIVGVYRYPVKGLGPDRLIETSVEAGGFLPFDRAYAVENGDSGFDAKAPRGLPKSLFLCLMRNAGLAALSTRFDPASGRLALKAPDGDGVEAPLDTAEGREAIAEFLTRYMGEEARGPLAVLSAPGHTFADTGEAYVSLLNLESVRALGREMGVELDPLRFRANLHLEGVPAFAEFGWLGQRIAVGRDGPVLTAVRRIRRCAATRVDPDTGIRDHDVPQGLMRAYGHLDCGIYATVERAGTIRSGARLTVAPAAEREGL